MSDGAHAAHASATPVKYLARRVSTDIACLVDAAAVVPRHLDYLAARFIERGWSIKHIHRLIMLSRVYQQSSEADSQVRELDPDNRWLARMNRQRLEFEALRDSLLAIGGQLDLTMFGRPVDLTKEPYSTRRTIYGYVDRSDVADVLINFDFANPEHR